MKTAIIYNIETGLLDGGYIIFNENTPPDGSTIAERIPEIVAKEDNRAVVYFDGIISFDQFTQKIVNDEVVNI